MDASYRTSAKIYQFPVRHRDPKAAGERFSLGAREVVVDDNWYHQAAIQAAMQEAKPREH